MIPHKWGKGERDLRTNSPSSPITGKKGRSQKKEEKGEARGGKTDVRTHLSIIAASIAAKRHETQGGGGKGHRIDKLSLLLLLSSFVSVEILRIPPPPRRLNTDHCNLPDDRTTKKQKKTTRWGGREGVMRVLPFPPPAGFCAVRTCSVCPSPVSHRHQSQVSRVPYVMCVQVGKQERKELLPPPPLFSQNALRTHRTNGLGPTVPSSSSSVFTLLSIPPSKYFHVRSTLAFFSLQQPGEEKGKPPSILISFILVAPKSSRSWAAKTAVAWTRTDGLSAAEDRGGGISSHALT